MTHAVTLIQADNENTVEQKFLGHRLTFLFVMLLFPFSHV